MVAADMLNDCVLPFFEESNIPLLRFLTDRGTKFAASGNTTDLLPRFQRLTRSL